LSHSIEEYDQLRLLSSLGHTVASIGGYIDPRNPHSDMRPPLDLDPVEEVRSAVDGLGTDDNLTAAQTRLPDAVLDWADVIIYHHHLDRLFGQWDRIRAWLHAGSQRRVIWRTVGQSTDYNEAQAAPYRRQGLEIVRYSPKERNIPRYAGEDALIRFYKDPAEYSGWTGENPVVLNISQHDEVPHARDPWINWRFWTEATAGLPTVFAGPHTDKIGGLGKVSHDEMKRLLRTSRAYLYTGTQPASYTLGLIESLMTGVPTISIGPERMMIFPYGPSLFEGHELASGYARDAASARESLRALLDVTDIEWSTATRRKAIDLFGMETIARQWAEYLDGSRVEFSTARETVTA
jgi:hypothetical protein